MKRFINPVSIAGTLVRIGHARMGVGIPAPDPCTALGVSLVSQGGIESIVSKLENALVLKNEIKVSETGRKAFKPLSYILSVMQVSWDLNPDNEAISSKYPGFWGGHTFYSCGVFPAKYFCGEHKQYSSA